MWFLICYNISFFIFILHEFEFNVREKDHEETDHRVRIINPGLEKFINDLFLEGIILFLYFSVLIIFIELFCNLSFLCLDYLFLLYSIAHKRTYIDTQISVDLCMLQAQRHTDGHASRENLRLPRSIAAQRSLKTCVPLGAGSSCKEPVGIRNSSDNDAKNTWDGDK